MGPKNTGRRRKREERGPVKEDPCHARVKGEAKLGTLVTPGWGDRTPPRYQS